MRKPIACSLVLSLACLAALAAPSLLLAEAIDPQKAKASPDGKTLWYDCKDLVVEGKGWTDTPSFYDRLPAKAQGKVPPAVWDLSHHSAGLCVRFTTDAPTIQVRWTLSSANLAMPHMPATGVSGVDLYAKDKAGRWRFVGNGRPNAVSNTASFTPPAGEQLLLYLPLYNGTKSVEIGIPKGRTISGPMRRRSSSGSRSCSTALPLPKGAALRGRAWPPRPSSAGNWTRRSSTWASAAAERWSRQWPTCWPNSIRRSSCWIVSGTCRPSRSRNVSSRSSRGCARPIPNTPILLAEDSNFQNVCPTEKGRILRAAIEKLTAEGVKNLHFLPAET